jgi:acyl-CoA reductase-like NAD-dependent aldehyde dehydrogenase
MTDRSTTLAVRAPATGAVVQTVPNRTPEDVAALVARARAAQSQWVDLGWQGRHAVLQRAKAWMYDHRRRFITALVEETGKPYEEAQAEVVYAASALDFWSRNAERWLADDAVTSRSPMLMAHRMRMTHRPRGVVGVIGPWNVPLMNSFGDCIPALAAGNAVVLKPSEVTPLSALLSAEMMDAVGMPADVFLVATGDGATGAALVDHVDFVHFTGSARTGKLVAHRAIDAMVPYTLELGGKDPLLVLSDADLERAASAAVFYGLVNAGQACVSVERIYVEAPVYDRFVELVVDQVRGLRQGAGSTTPGQVDVGPVIHPPQAAIVQAHLDDARERGARILVGGKIHEAGGTFVEPTVLVDVDHEMRCMREETFGPTLPIMRVADEAEAIARANDSVYGLGASVFTKSRERGDRVAAQLDAGTVLVNDAIINYFALEIPMGGHKESGIGSRHSRAGIEKYTDTKVVITRRFSPKRDPYWFPYTGSSARLFAAMHRLFYRRVRG